MKPIHAFAIAVVLAIAAVLGVAAMTRTTSLGASAKQTSAATIQARAHKLDAFEASLKKALKNAPPALPKASATSAAVSAAPRVVYHRPAPIIIHKHRAGGESEHESEGGSDD